MDVTVRAIEELINCDLRYSFRVGCLSSHAPSILLSKDDSIFYLGGNNNNRGGHSSSGKTTLDFDAQLAVFNYFLSCYDMSHFTSSSTSSVLKPVGVGLYLCLNTTSIFLVDIHENGHEVAQIPIQALQAICIPTKSTYAQTVRSSWGYLVKLQLDSTIASIRSNNTRRVKHDDHVVLVTRYRKALIDAIATMYSSYWMSTGDSVKRVPIIAESFDHIVPKEIASAPLNSTVYYSEKGFHRFYRAGYSFLGPDKVFDLHENDLNRPSSTYLESNESGAFRSSLIVRLEPSRPRSSYLNCEAAIHENLTNTVVHSPLQLIHRNTFVLESLATNEVENYRDLEDSSIIVKKRIDSVSAPGNVSNSTFENSSRRKSSVGAGMVFDDEHEDVHDIDTVLEGMDNNDLVSDPGDEKYPIPDFSPEKKPRASFIDDISAENDKIFPNKPITLNEISTQHLNSKSIFILSRNSLNEELSRLNSMGISQWTSNLVSW